MNIFMIFLNWRIWWAELVVRVTVTEIFENSPRYIHKYLRVQDSKYTPKADFEKPLTPQWKLIDGLQKMSYLRKKRQRQKRWGEQLHPKNTVNSLWRERASNCLQMGPYKKDKYDEYSLDRLRLFLGYVTREFVSEPVNKSLIPLYKLYC